LPILEEFKEWLEKNSRRVPKDSLTYKAIHYTLNQWDTLIGYCEDGQLHISNALQKTPFGPSQLVGVTGYSQTHPVVQRPVLRSLA
jgi:hypothetical protein